MIGRLRSGGLSLIALVICTIMASGCCGCFGEITYPSYSYTIQINGLANFTKNGTTVILVPVPVVDNEPLFDSAEANSRSGDWSVTLADSEYGKMLSFMNNRTNLQDVNIEYVEIFLTDRSYGQQEEIINRSLSAPLRPYSSAEPHDPVYLEPPGKYRAWNYYAVKNYSSIVYIDKDIQSLPNSTSTIEIILKYDLQRRMSPGRGATQDWAGAHEFIPAGVTGYVPVTIGVWSTPHNQ